jgi:hypothetical protein
VRRSRESAVRLSFRTGRVRYSALRQFKFLALCFCPQFVWHLRFQPVAGETFSVGALTGLATSVLDRFWWDRVNNRLGFLVALFGIPMLSGGIVILLFRYIDTRRARSATP